jgi:hypothetical protein
VEFSRRYDHGANADVLADIVLRSFLLHEPPAIVVLGLEDGVPVAHTLLMVQQTPTDGVWLEVRQYECDRGYELPHGMVGEWLGEIALGVRKRFGATEIRVAALDERLASHYEREYGFTRDKILMRRPIPEPEGGTDG